MEGAQLPGLAYRQETMFCTARALSALVKFAQPSLTRPTSQPGVLVKLAGLGAKVRSVVL